MFTLVYDPKRTPWLPKNQKIITSFINKLPNSKNNPIYYTPLYIPAVEQFDFSGFDIIISTTSTIGHSLITPASSLFVCYFHNINRYLYNTPKKFLFLKSILNLYKKYDNYFKYRPDYVFCNSKTVQKRIIKHYNLTPKIIHPGIDLKLFSPLPKSQQSISSYFLIVSRLVPHKKIDLAIKACHVRNVELKIVGTGRLEKQLKTLISSLNNDKIKLLGPVSQKRLINLYQHCRALICPQNEDFGITPIEAQACGKPVIAYNKGGVTETVISEKTGLFFRKQTTKSLSFAIKNFNPDNFSSTDCIKNANRFSDQIFMLNFKKSVLMLWQQKQKTTT